MTNIAHILETALLLLAAYLLGCVLGYAARRILFAARGTRQVAPDAIPTPAPLPPSEPTARPVARRSPAARLAATASDEPMPVTAPARSSKPPAKSKPAAANSKPSTLAEPRNGQADNLKQIKGIGPKIEASLNALGIYHLDQIAGWSKANIDWVDGHLAFKGRIRREQWVEQATELTKVGA